MRRFRLLSGLLLGAALIVPVAARAGGDDRDHDRRYYDRDGHDYHRWDDHEDRAYRAYLGEQHQEYREFRRVRPAHQREYFKWRHEHPDTTLFKVEIR
jgi:hypothetical protein